MIGHHQIHYDRSAGDLQRSVRPSGRRIVLCFELPCNAHGTQYQDANRQFFHRNRFRTPKSTLARKTFVNANSLRLKVGSLCRRLLSIGHVMCDGVGCQSTIRIQNDARARPQPVIVSKGSSVEHGDSRTNFLLRPG